MLPWHVGQISAVNLSGICKDMDLNLSIFLETVKAVSAYQVLNDQD